MAGELNEVLEEQRARIDALEILLSGLIAVLVREKIVDDKFFTTDLLELEEAQRRENAHAARIEVFRTAREMALEEISGRKSKP